MKNSILLMILLLSATLALGAANEDQKAGQSDYVVQSEEGAFPAIAADQSLPQPLPLRRDVPVTHLCQDLCSCTPPGTVDVAEQENHECDEANKVCVTKVNVMCRSFLDSNGVIFKCKDCAPPH